jgi:hypothetical protein
MLAQALEANGAIVYTLDRRQEVLEQAAAIVVRGAYLRREVYLATVIHQTVIVRATYAYHDACIMQLESAKRLVNLLKILVFFVTGEATCHASYDYCRAE